MKTPEEKITAIDAWLKGSRDFNEGLNLLLVLASGNRNNKVRSAFQKIRSHCIRTKNNPNPDFLRKLGYILEYERDRLAGKERFPKVNNPKPEKGKIIEPPEDLTILEKVAWYLKSGRDYSVGYKILDALSTEFSDYRLQFLQLYQVETAESRLRLDLTLKTAYKELSTNGE